MLLLGSFSTDFSTDYVFAKIQRNVTEYFVTEQVYEINSDNTEDFLTEIHAHSISDLVIKYNKAFKTNALTKINQIEFNIVGPTSNHMPEPNE